MVPWREKVRWLEIFKTRQDQSEYKGTWDQLPAGEVWKEQELGRDASHFPALTEMLICHIYKRPAFFIYCIPVFLLL